MMMLQYLRKSRILLYPPLIRTYKPKKIVQDPTFTVSYLNSTCGLSGESLIRASKLISFDPDDKRPDLVLNLLKTYGFSQTHCAKVVVHMPLLLFFDADKILKPKLDFIKSVVQSDDDMIEIMVRNPSILRRSLEKQLVPVFNLLNDLMGSHQNAVEAVKRRPAILSWNTSKVLPNIELLREHNVPDAQISRLVTEFCQAIYKPQDRFRNGLLKVMEMGFEPSSWAFMQALTSMVFCKTSTWEARVEVYRSLGFTNDEIVLMFKKQPIALSLSPKRVRATVKFFVDKLRWSPTKLSTLPFNMLYSLEQRIIPRCSVLQALVLRNKIPAKFKLGRKVAMVEKKFVEKYVLKYKDEVPEVLDAYKGKLRFDEYSFDC